MVFEGLEIRTEREKTIYFQVLTTHHAYRWFFMSAWTRKLAKLSETHSLWRTHYNSS